MFLFLLGLYGLVENCAVAGTESGMCGRPAACVTWCISGALLVFAIPVPRLPPLDAQPGEGRTAKRECVLGFICPFCELNYWGIKIKLLRTQPGILLNHSPAFPSLTNAGWKRFFSAFWPNQKRIKFSSNSNQKGTWRLWPNWGWFRVSWKYLAGSQVFWSLGYLPFNFIFFFS